MTTKLCRRALLHLLNTAPTMVSRESHWVSLDLALPKPISNPLIGKSGGPTIPKFGVAVLDAELAYCHAGIGWKSLLSCC
ncbi:glycosyltransferase family 77 protein [Corchorus olitorius]|uniref:Glycosyltransferase family 77 protein n=1 Tax=Corchorus olitorius TaxID=93759 RepID=A0A1R3KJ92_9ROSI|nr:glycosyltransferase family 77 protein [Corchorus olitorius]